MSTTSRSSRVTALAIAIAIGASGTIAITPVSGAQTTTTTQQQQLENIREINVSDYAATPGDRENGGGKDSSIQTFASPGEQLKVTSSIPSEDIDNIELLYMGREVSAYENTPDPTYDEFLKWFYDHIQFDADTGIVTIEIPKDKWEWTDTQDGLILAGERSPVHNDDTSGYVQLGYNFGNAGDGNDPTNLPTENFIVSTMDPAGYDLFQDLTDNQDFVSTQGQRTVIPNALHEPGTVYSPEWVTHEKYEEQENQATNNGDLVLSPGYGVEPGTHDLVIDTKLDGSSESDDDFSTQTIIIPDYITVNPSELNDDFSPTYPATEVESGGSATATINYGQSSPGDSQSPTYGIPESFNAPEGWTVTVNKDTGVLNVTAPETTESATVEVPVTVSYPDGTTDTVTAGITLTVLTADITEPSWEDTTINPGQRLTIPSVGDDIPEDADIRVTGLPRGWTTGIGQNNDILVTAPDSAEDESTQTMTITVTYADGSTDVVEVEVVIGDRNDNDVYDPFYSTTTVAQNKSDNISIAYQGDAPANASYSKGAGFPEWAELNDDGTITINPTFAGTTLGSHQVNVQVSYDDGTSESVITAGVTVTRGADNDNYSLSYLGGTVKQGESITLDPVITDYNRASASPDDAAYRILSGPEWISVDANTGVVNARPSIDVTMSSYEFEVEVIYQDGTRDTTRSGVNISGTTDATRYQLTYGGGTRVEQGDTVTGVSPVRTIGEPMPDGTTLTAIDAPSWITVNEDGSYTVAPGYRVGAGSYPVTVMVSYPDRSSENMILPIAVTRAEIAKEFDSPTYQSISVTQGQSVSSSAPTQGTRTLPTGTSYRLQYGAPNWVSLDPSTGVITLEPGFKVSPGLQTIPVDIVYPDGSGLTTELELKVESGKFSDGYNPSYSSGLDAPQGSQVTIPAPRDSDGQRLPVGTKYDTHKDNPTWIAVGVDGTVTASPGYKVEPGAYQGITVVTYEDGTVDQVPIAIRVLPEDDPAEAPVTSTPQGFTDYSEEYIPSWQRSEGGTSVSVSDIPEGYSVNDQGEVVDSQGRTVDGASISNDGRVTVPGQTTTTSGPSVNTGGHVSSSGLWNWAVSLFR